MLVISQEGYLMDRITEELGKVGKVITFNPAEHELLVKRLDKEFADLGGNEYYPDSKKERLERIFGRANVLNLEDVIEN